MTARIQSSWRAMGVQPAVSRLVPPRGSTIETQLRLFYSRNQMQNRTETLRVGLTAPEFTLSAANREGSFSLSDLRKQGTIVLEFLRGTW
jgi:hypothetical protein